MEHIVDFVCFAPMVQILDALVPQTVEKLQDVLQFFDRLSTVPKPVIEVPKISTEDVPMRAVLCALAEQLVEVPTIISNPLLLLLQALLEHKQRTVEQNVDIPAVGGSGAGGGLSGFVLWQNSWWKCRRSSPILSCCCCRRFWSTSSGLWSRTLTFQLWVVVELVEVFPVFSQDRIIL